MTSLPDFAFKQYSDSSSKADLHKVRLLFPFTFVYVSLSIFACATACFFFLSTTLCANNFQNLYCNLLLFALFCIHSNQPQIKNFISIFFRITRIFRHRFSVHAIHFLPSNPPPLPPFLLFPSSSSCSFVRYDFAEMKFTCDIKTVHVQTVNGVKRTRNGTEQGTNTENYAHVFIFHEKCKCHLIRQWCLRQ